MKARIPEGSRYGSADGTDVLVAGTLNAAAFANAAAQAYPLTLRHKGTYVHHSCVLPVMFAMPFFTFYWDSEIVAHLAVHDVKPDDFECVVNSPDRRGKSRSTGRPCCWGETADGRYLLCIYEYIDEVWILPVTAYEVARPNR